MFSVFIIALIISGCSGVVLKDELNVTDEYFEHFNGELFSVIKHEEDKKQNIFKNYYTVTLVNSDASMRERYMPYNESNQTNEDIIVVSDRTKIFGMVDENRKKLINKDKLIEYKGKRIDYWIQPLKGHPEWLEAIEINIKTYDE